MRLTAPLLISCALLLGLMACGGDDDTAPTAAPEDTAQSKDSPTASAEDLPEKLRQLAKKLRQLALVKPLGAQLLKLRIASARSP